MFLACKDARNVCCAGDFRLANAAPVYAILQEGVIDPNNEAQTLCRAKGATYLEKVLIKGINASSNARVCTQPFLVVGVQGVAHQPCHWAPHAYKIYARSAKRCAGISSW